MGEWREFHFARWWVLRYESISMLVTTNQADLSGSCLAVVLPFGDLSVNDIHAGFSRVLSSSFLGCSLDCRGCPSNGRLVMGDNERWYFMAGFEDM